MTDNNGRDERLISDMSRCAPASRTNASRETITITDFSSCEPQTFVSRHPETPGIWQLKPYKAGDVEGFALFGTETTLATPVVYRLSALKLKGWYEVRYGMWDHNPPHYRPPGEGIHARLSKDPDWSTWEAHAETKSLEVNERVWKIADLAGQDLHLAQIPVWRHRTLPCTLASLKLIPIPTPKHVNTSHGTWKLSKYAAPERGVEEGVGLEVDEDCFGEEIVLPLGEEKLAGWYDVYVGLYDPVSPHDEKYNFAGIDIRTTGESGFTHLPLHPTPGWNEPYFSVKRGFFRERLWKRVKMDGQDIHLRQKSRFTTWCGPGVYKPDYIHFNVRCGVAWLRLVPAEAVPSVSEPVKAKKPMITVGWDTDALVEYNATTEGDVRQIVRTYVRRAEDCNILVLGPTLSIDKTTYPTKVGEPGTQLCVTKRQWDELSIQGRRSLIENGVNVLTVSADEAHRMGLDFWVMLRMGAWGSDSERNSGPFFRNHPEYCIINKDGVHATAKMSYAYPEVRDYVVALFREIIGHCQAGGGRIDGISPGFLRGPEFVGYEPHVCEAFQKEYGEDPLELPDDDGRWLKFRARHVTQLMEDLREMLDEESKKQKTPIKLIPYTFSNEQVNLRYALDVREWVEKGLVDVLIADPNIGGWDTLDPDFYKEMRSKGNVQIILYGARWGMDELKAQFDGLDGAATAPDSALDRDGLGRDHPIAGEGELSIDEPMPADTGTRPPGTQTAQVTVIQVGRMALTPGYGSGF